MARTGDNIKIPVSEEEALRLAFKVKPTKEMPRPGATTSKAKASGIDGKAKRKTN